MQKRWMFPPPESRCASEYRVYSVEGRSQTGFAGVIRFQWKLPRFIIRPGSYQGLNFRL